MAEQELTHHGTKGMKWGVRRYQPYTDGKKGRFLGKTKPKKPPINTKGLSMRDANAKRRLMTSTTKGKKTIDVNPTAKAKLDKLNAKQKVAIDKQKLSTIKKKEKLKFDAGVVDSRILAGDVLNKVGIAHVSNIAGSATASQGQIQAGMVLQSIGHTAAAGMFL